MGNAVRAVWASSQGTAASDLFGALGGLVRDARAGAVHGGGVWANSHAFPKTLGGLVGGAVATVAELHSGDGGKYTQSSTAGAQSNKSGGPPAIPASVALKIVTQTCCEFLYEPGAGGGSETDDRLRRAREVLRCAPEGCQESVAHYPQGESASRLDLLEGPYESIPAGCEESVAHYPHGETLGSCRAVVATVTLLRNLGVEYSPGRLKREGVSFVGTDNGNKAPHFHLLQHVIDTSHKRAVDTTSYGRLVSDKKTQKHEKAPNGVPTRAEVWELATCLLLTQNESDTHDVELRIGQAALARNDFADALASLEVLVEARFSSAWGFVSRFVEAAGAVLDELDEKRRKETCEGRTETFDRDDHEDDPVVPDRTSLKTFLAFALAAAPRDTKPALLARWQAMETRSLYAAVLGTRFRADTDNSRRTDQEGDVTTTSDGHTETRELAARAIGARSVTHKNRDPTAYGFLRQTAGRERAAAEVAKPRSAARALAEGRDFRRLLCVFQKAAENTDTENTVSNENTESESAAAFALSYGLGTAGVCVLDHLMSPLIRDVRAAEMYVVDAGDKSDVGDKNEARTANGVCLGLLVGLKESKSVTSTMDSFSLTKTTHDAQTTLALGTRAHALRLVPAGDFEARQKALNADTNELLVSSTNESNTGDHSKEFRESKKKLALVTNAEFVCGMLGKATHKSVSFPGKQQRVDDFVSDATKRAELIVSLARACPSVALFGYGQTDIAETQSELEKVRDELFRIAETHGVDLLQCAVSFATGLVAATDGDENTEQSLAGTCWGFPKSVNTLFAHTRLTPFFYNHSSKRILRFLGKAIRDVPGTRRRIVNPNNPRRGATAFRRFHRDVWRGTRGVLWVAQKVPAGFKRGVFPFREGGEPPKNASGVGRRSATAREARGCRGCRRCDVACDSGGGASFVVRVVVSTVRSGAHRRVSGETGLRLSTGGKPGNHGGVFCGARAGGGGGDHLRGSGTSGYLSRERAREVRGHRALPSSRYG